VESPRGGGVGGIRQSAKGAVRNRQHVEQVITARLAERDVEPEDAAFRAHREMIDLFQHVGPVQVVDREAGTVEIEVPLEPRPNSGSCFASRRNMTSRVRVTRRR
jgi:hypothetical protein